MPIKLPNWFSVIKHSLCHRTGVEGLGGIFKTGAIVPNDGSIADTYPQSKKSYARHNGLVSLFDLNNFSEDECRHHIHDWYRFFFDHKPVTVVIILRREHLHSKLIANEKAVIDTRGTFDPIFIPKFEVFYPEPIPCDAFCGYLLICSVYETVCEHYRHDGIDPGIFNKIERFINKHREIYADPTGRFERDIDRS